MSEPFVISIHIPKTAGTSLADIFSRCFARRVLFDYDGYNKPQVIDPLVHSNISFIRAYFDVLHGHFVAKKYLEVIPDARFVATLRHPVDRVISQYLHELNETSSAAWYHDDIVSGRMDVIDFAMQEGIGDAQHKHLAGKPVSHYDLLLISEKLHLSLRLFKRLVKPIDLQAHFGNDILLPSLNSSRDRDKSVTFGEDIRARIFEKTAPDNAIYAEAVSLLDRLAMRWL